MASGLDSHRRLSVAMIVRDAARFLEPTLKSVAPIADEVVVADTGSIDETRKIAEQWASQVFEVPWADDFAAARNACLAATRGDWVLWLDAGETIGDSTAAALREFVESQAETDRLYKLLVQFKPAAGYFADQQIAMTRLIPRREELRFEGRVRERVVAAGGEPLAETLLRWTIVRDAMDHDPLLRQQRAQRNLKLAELEIAAHRSDADALLALGEALAQLGEHEEARRAYLRARQISARASDEMLESYYGELTSYDAREDRRQEQLELCIEALEIFPTDMQLLCAMGGYLQSQQKIELAARAYKTSVEYGQVNPNVWHLADIKDIAVVCLALVYEIQGRNAESQAILENAIEQRPDALRVRHQLFDLYIRQGRRTKALQQIDMLPRDMPLRDAFANAVLGACLANERDWRAAQAYLETAYEAGCRDPLCFRGLITTFLALGKITAAADLLKEWRFHDPGNQEIDILAAKLPADQHGGALRDGIQVGGDLADRQFRVDKPKSSHARQPAPPVPQKGKGRVNRAIEP